MDRTRSDDYQKSVVTAPDDFANLCARPVYGSRCPWRHRQFFLKNNRGHHYLRPLDAKIVGDKRLVITMLTMHLSRLPSTAIGGCTVARAAPPGTLASRNLPSCPSHQVSLEATGIAFKAAYVGSPNRLGAL